VGTLELPPSEYLWPNRYLFGPWRELGTMKDPELFVTLRPGWVVQVGEGAAGAEKPVLQLDRPGDFAKMATNGKSRLVFRARQEVPREEDFASPAIFDLKDEITELDSVYWRK
jgi:hypothetical protein